MLFYCLLRNRSRFTYYLFIMASDFFYWFWRLLLAAIFFGYYFWFFFLFLLELAKVYDCFEKFLFVAKVCVYEYALIFYFLFYNIHV
jgi:hypothetical protein